MTSFGLQGNFAPVECEVESGPLSVTGTLPDYLDGVYVRNGPNPVGAPDPDRYNRFVGDGMVHGVRIRGGRAAWYRNRWVRSANVCATLGLDPPAAPRGADARLGPNTSVVRHAGRTLVLTEGGPAPYEIDDDLDTVGPYDLCGSLRGAYSAHPRVDPATGELHAVSYLWRWGGYVRYTVTSADGATTTATHVSVGGRPMVHDLALTATRSVLLDLPVTFRRENLRAGPAGGRASAGALAVEAPSQDFPYAWEDGYPPRLGLLDRTSPDRAHAKWYDVDPCFVFHMLNAYDDDAGTVVVDVLRRERAFVPGRPDSLPYLERWTVDPAAGTVARRLLDDRPQEFPRIDDRRAGRRARGPQRPRRDVRRRPGGARQSAAPGARPARVSRGLAPVGRDPRVGGSPARSQDGTYGRAGARRADLTSP